MGNKPNPFLIADGGTLMGRFLRASAGVRLVEGACGSLVGVYPFNTKPPSTRAIAGFVVRLPL